MSEFTQGVCADGAAILKDGVMLTIEEIIELLRRGDALDVSIKLEGLNMTICIDGKHCHCQPNDASQPDESRFCRVKFVADEQKISSRYRAALEQIRAIIASDSELPYKQVHQIDKIVGKLAEVSGVKG